MFKPFAAAGIALAATLSFSQPALSATAVDVELSLLVDVSGSVNANEFALQRGGYVSAFRNPLVHQAITGGTIGSIAVNYIYWSGSDQQQEAVGWTQIGSAAQSNAFAASIEATTRPFNNLTSISGALDFSVGSFEDNGFNGTTKIIDVSGDGRNNDGRSVTAARDDALGVVDRINGIAIGNQSLLNYYTDNVIGGPEAFALLATTFDDFEGAILKKLFAEISGTDPDDPLPNPIPLPAAAWMLLAGLGALVGLGRRRQTAAA